MNIPPPVKPLRAPYLPVASPAVNAASLGAPTPASVAAPPAPAPAPRKRERNADSTKKDLLNAGEIEFAAKGFDGARLQSIARAVGVQQALIHHYFDDKEGLYRAVIERGMAAVTAGSWTLLESMAEHGSRTQDPHGKVDLRALVTGFVDLIVDFYAAHTTLLAILKHDAEKPAPTGHLPELRPLLATHFRPVIDAVVVVVEGLKRSGTLRADVDPRHLCVSTMAMACTPFQETQMFAVLWPEADFRAPAMIAERKREIVEMLLGRVLA